jgi:NAD(P)-dependent dehydrogenase (short-subunit alcohol dehydrogenase family)
MRTVVITGSSKGFGLEMGKEFLNQGFNVVLSGDNEQNLARAFGSLRGNPDKVITAFCDVRNPEDLRNLWEKAYETWGTVDIWINNAGIAQKANKLWESSVEEVKNVFDTNLMGAFYGTQVAVNGMLKQGFGKVYNTVGFGSTGMTRTGLNIYGTSKHAIAHFSKAFANELKGTDIIVGTLQPGMMVTDFVKASVGNTYDNAAVQKIYNVLGDLPDVPAKYLVKRMISNHKNGKLLSWQSNGKIAYRFLKSIFVKRNLFNAVNS